MATKKSWLDKLNENKEPKIKRIEIDFADIPSGSYMLICKLKNNRYESIHPRP